MKKLKFSSHVVLVVCSTFFCVNDSFATHSPAPTRVNVRQTRIPADDIMNLSSLQQKETVLVPTNLVAEFLESNRINIDGRKCKACMNSKLKEAIEGQEKARIEKMLTEELKRLSTVKFPPRVTHINFILNDECNKIYVHPVAAK